MRYGRHHLFYYITGESSAVVDNRKNYIVVKRLMETKIKHLMETKIREGWLSGRKSDSQSRKPRFEYPLVPFQNVGIFVIFMACQFTRLFE